MAYWWGNLLSKEKAAAVAGGLAVALLLIYLLIQPLISNRAKLQEEVSNRRAELTWMRDAAREIEQSGYLAQKDAGATPPLQFIDQAARENHLGEQLKRVEPGPDGEIKLWLHNASYVDLVRWLRQLSGTGDLQITNLSVEKGDNPGRVSAQLILNSGRTP